MENFYETHKHAFLNGYLRTISNIRIHIIDDTLKKCMRKINESIKLNILDFTSFKDYIEQFKSSDVLKTELLGIKEIKYCNITSEDNTTICLLNPEHINISLKKRKVNTNLKIEIINDVQNNKELISNYLTSTDNSLLRNNHRKNNKKKESICKWKDIYIYKKDNNYDQSMSNQFHLSEEKITIKDTIISRTLINTIQLNNDQLITSGRTLLPGTIFFTFHNKNIVSLKNDWIQIIPAKTDKDETYESLCSNINNLLLIINNLLIYYCDFISFNEIEGKNKEMENKEYFKKNIREALLKNVDFNCDFIYKLNTHIIVLPIIYTTEFLENLKQNEILSNINIKNQTNCLTIRNIKNVKQFHIFDNFVKQNIVEYENITNLMENLSIKEILYLTQEEIETMYSGCLLF